MPPHTTQPSLLSRVRDAGDDAAWREFDAEYRELILRFCRSRGLQQADAEDVRQLVMMGLSRSMRGFRYRRDRGRFRDYLGRVVRNAVTAYVSCPVPARSTLYDAELDALAAPDSRADDETWEREWMHHHFRQAMRKCRKCFDPRSLAVFERLLAGGSVPDLAASFGVTPAAVYKIKHRVRDQLQQLIAEQVRDEEFPARSG